MANKLPGPWAESYGQPQTAPPPVPAPPPEMSRFDGPLPIIAPPARAPRPTPERIAQVKAKIKAPSTPGLDAFLAGLGQGPKNDLTPEQWQMAQQADEMQAKLAAQAEADAAAKVLNDQEREARMLDELHKIYGISPKGK